MNFWIPSQPNVLANVCKVQNSTFASAHAILIMFKQLLHLNGENINNKFASIVCHSWLWFNQIHIRFWSAWKRSINFIIDTQFASIPNSHKRLALAFSLQTEMIRPKLIRLSNIKNIDEWSIWQKVNKTVAFVWSSGSTCVCLVWENILIALCHVNFPRYFPGSCNAPICESQTILFWNINVLKMSNSSIL